MNFATSHSEETTPIDFMDPAMFSLAESDSHYILAIDIPTIPASSTEILTSKNQLTVEGESVSSKDRQTIFRLLPNSNGIKTIYKEGVLWLLLPKMKMESQSSWPIEFTAD